ncbi:MAG: cob(I)yrinic acid a,c-diamide adenosyltransferase, partial [Clostridiales bacterium]
MANRLGKGLVEIYTGNAKGKSTAAFGLAIRGAGHGYGVRIVQFMKTGQYGENVSLDKLKPQIELMAYGRKGFLNENDPQKEDIDLAHQALKKSEEYLLAEDTDILILDELNNAIFFKLITVEEALAFLDKKPENVEVVLTGRNAPKELIDRADYVTEMKEVKH